MDGQIALSGGAHLQHLNISIQHIAQIKQTVQMLVHILGIVIIFRHLFQRKAESLQGFDRADLSHIIRRIVAKAAFLILDRWGQQSHILIEQDRLAGHTEDLCHFPDFEQVIPILFHNNHLLL